MPAAQTGQIFTGDLIMEVDGVALQGKSHEEVVQLLKDSPGPQVTLTLRRDSQVSPILRPATSKHSIQNIDVNMFFKV